MVAAGQNELSRQPWKSLFITKKMWADFTIHSPKIVALFGFTLELRGDVLKPLNGVFNKKIFERQVDGKMYTKSNVTNPTRISSININPTMIENDIQNPARI